MALSLSCYNFYSLANSAFYFPAPRVASIAAAIEHIYPLVEEFKKERTKEDELEMLKKQKKLNGMKKVKEEEETEFLHHFPEAQEPENSDEDSDLAIDESVGA